LSGVCLDGSTTSDDGQVKSSPSQISFDEPSTIWFEEWCTSSIRIFYVFDYKKNYQLTRASGKDEEAISFAKHVSSSEHELYKHFI
jgi:hypothetical protein